MLAVDLTNLTVIGQDPEDNIYLQKNVPSLSNIFGVIILNHYHYDFLYPSFAVMYEISIII